MAQDQMWSDEDYWDPDDSQQLLGDAEVTVLQSFWSTPRIQNKGKNVDWDGADNTQLYWLCRIDEVWQESYDKMVPESFTINMSIGGEGWLSDEAGRFVEHKDDPDPKLVKRGQRGGKPIQFKGSSLFGKFLGLCNGRYDDYYTQTNVDPLVAPVMVLDDGDDIVYDLAGVRVAQRQRKVGNPRDAAIWVGMRFRTRGVGFVYRNTKGIPSFKVVPTAYLGFDAEVAAAADAGGNGVLPGSTAPAAVDASVIAKRLPSSTPADVVEELTTMLATSSSHTEFMRKALNTEYVKDPDNAEAKAAVMDKSDAGVWAGKFVQPDAETDDDSTAEPATTS